MDRQVYRQRSRRIADAFRTACGVAGVVVAEPGLAQGPDGAPAASDGIVQIIAHADIVVKFVLIVLLMASIASWTLFIVKGRELRAAKGALAADVRLLNGASDLQLPKVAYRATAEMLDVAATELGRAGGAPTRRMLKGVEDRVAAQLPLVQARAIHRIQRGINGLASIGAIAPFVGLAGTVWGIVNSFLGIASTQSTSLAVVAPGIAEALIATAAGLAAAIPAVIIYNGLTRSISGYVRLLSEVGVLTECILNREAEQRDILADTPRLRDGAAPSVQRSELVR